jgi:hypothetical protein
MRLYGAISQNAVNLIIIIQFFILMCCTNSQMANYRYSTKKIIIIRRIKIIKKKYL